MPLFGSLYCNIAIVSPPAVHVYGLVSVAILASVPVPAWRRCCIGLAAAPSARKNARNGQDVSTCLVFLPDPLCDEHCWPWHRQSLGDEQVLCCVCAHRRCHFDGASQVAARAAALRSLSQIGDSAGRTKVKLGAHRLLHQGQSGATAQTGQRAPEAGAILVSRVDRVHVGPQQPRRRHG